jgi:hypothetical protein
MKNLLYILLAVVSAFVIHTVGDVHIIDAGVSAFAAVPLLATVKRPHITADATVINEAYLMRTLIPQLVNEYQNDREGFLSVLNGVPASAVGSEGVYKNRLISNPEAVINNTVDFTGPEAHDKKSMFVPWDSVDTKPNKVVRSELRGLPYDIKSELRIRHMNSIKRATRDKLLHTISPASNTADTPVIGLADGMTYATLIDIRRRILNMNMDPRDFMVILTAEHVADLANEQGAGSKFRDVMFDEKRGDVKPFAGFPNIFEHAGMPKYDAYNLTRNAFGSVNGTAASLVINVPEVIFHRETMKAYLKPEVQDTRSADPGDEFRLGGYFAASTLVNKGFFALVTE